MPEVRRLWYVRRGGRTQGPFPAALITRYLLLGRIRGDDELSTDREHWRPVADLPELQHPDMSAAGGGAAAGAPLQAARLREDERSGEDRRNPGVVITTASERRRGERRRPESVQAVEYRQHRRRRYLRERGRGGEKYLLRAVLVAVAIAAMVALAVMFPDRYARDTAQCGERAQPGINWSNCHLQGSALARADLHRARISNALLTGADLREANLSGGDLSYANLSLANLAGANLDQARLFGTSFRNADMSGAMLRGADLSYAILAGADLFGADLRDAVLDNAVWVDSRVCLPGSRGRCITSAGG